MVAGSRNVISHRFGVGAVVALMKKRVAHHIFTLLNVLSPYPVLYPLITLNAEDGQPTVLAGLGQTEEDGPEYAFGSSADGQQHLGERQYIKGDAAQQDDDSRAERKSLQPLLDFVKCLHFVSVLFFRIQSSAHDVSGRGTSAG